MPDHLDEAIGAATNAVIETRSSYETVLEVLEQTYLTTQEKYPNHGEQFQRAWAKARRAVLGANGWTDETFYAEMDRRRYLPPKSSP